MKMTLEMRHVEYMTPDIMLLMVDEMDTEDYQLKKFSNKDKQMGSGCFWNMTKPNAE